MHLPNFPSFSLKYRVCQYFQQDFEKMVNENANLTIVYKKLMDPRMDSIKDTLSQLKTRSRSWSFIYLHTVSFSSLSSLFFSFPHNLNLIITDNGLL